MPIQILLLGASGIPGRYILSSLLKLKAEFPSDVQITILKRPSSDINTQSNHSKASNEHYSIAHLQDYSDTKAFADLLTTLNPNIIISALNAEPAPVLDNHVVDAILMAREDAVGTHTSDIFFVNGYTLDLLHPCVSQLPDTAKASIKPKLEFAHRLRDLAAQGRLSYCTIVNAAFLDYCLIKGYSNVKVEGGTAVIVDGGTATITGCSLEFVGDAVALVVRCAAFGGERAWVVNRRLRIAETMYSGLELVECVEGIVGRKMEVTHEKSEDFLAAGAVIRYLNWGGLGASDFTEDGFEFGKGVLRRRGLKELCEMAIGNGVQVFS